jgi:hypothetical protein
MSRPWVVLSRFQGNERDGHGNHQTAGLVTQDAARLAGDPSAFPEQIAEGSRPWTPFKVYIGGVRPDEAWTVRIDSGEYSPWLGDSYDNIARYGLSFERSQNSGRFNPGAGPNFGYYRRVAARIPAPSREESVWDGLDTTYAGLFKTIGRTAPAAVSERLAGIDASVQRASAAFTLGDPAAAVPGLVDGLRLAREVIAAIAGEPEALFVMRIKERQFEEAINAALGLELTAVAQPGGTAEPTGPAAAFAPPAVMGPPVPGQTFGVVARLANRGGGTIVLGSYGASGVNGDNRATGAAIEIEAAPGWTVTPGPVATTTSLSRHELTTARFTVRLADDVAMSTRPYFSRAGLAASRYTLSDPSQFGRPASAPPLVAVARYSVNGVPALIRETVRRREPKLPYGDVLREVRSVPR